jgi:hypothetical protein
MIILKDAYVLTFNRNHECGMMSVLIDENRIMDIAGVNETLPYDREKTKVQKWIEKFGENAEVIDCSNKLIMPSFVNSCVRSEGSLFKYLLKNRHYENTEGDLCTDFIFNYLYQENQTEEMRIDLSNIYNYSFIGNLKSGICLFNEFSLRKDLNHLNPISKASENTGQKISACYPIKQDIKSFKDYKKIKHANYLTDEGQMTIYDISFLGELKNNGIKKLFLEVSTNKEICAKFQRSFNKTIIKLLDEYGLIDNDTSLINPLYLTYEELQILSEKKANIIICPSDLTYFSSRYLPFDDFVSSNIKFSIATGWTGNDIFSELRLLRNKYKELNIPGSEMLRAITSVPGELYFYDDQEYDNPCSISPNRFADLIFVDLSDVRFQLFPENLSFEKVCDFLIDNLSSTNITEVMINGQFKVRNNKLMEGCEEDIISSAETTRKRLYELGKYDELLLNKQPRHSFEKTDINKAEDENMIQFSESTPEFVNDETNETFRIKSKLPVFRHKSPPDQKNLFEDTEKAAIIQPVSYQESPELNLLYTEVEETKSEDDEILLTKIAEAKLLKQNPDDTKERTKKNNLDSKVELPKNVKLKFGDD